MSIFARWGLKPLGEVGEIAKVAKPAKDPEKQNENKEITPASWLRRVAKVDASPADRAQLSQPFAGGGESKIPAISGGSGDLSQDSRLSRLPGIFAGIATVEVEPQQTPEELLAEWRSGLRRLRAMPPPADFMTWVWRRGKITVEERFPMRRWRCLLADASAFLDHWGVAAAEARWSTADVFGAHPLAAFNRIDCAGLVLVLNGRRILSLAAEAATIEGDGGTGTTFVRRAPEPGTVPLWDVPAEAGVDWEYDSPPKFRSKLEFSDTDEAFAAIEAALSGRVPIGPDGDDATAWRAWMRERFRYRVSVGWSREQALRLAWGEGECEHHKRHGVPNNTDWRAAASAAMGAMGLAKPQAQHDPPLGSNGADARGGPDNDTADAWRAWIDMTTRLWAANGRSPEVAERAAWNDAMCRWRSENRDPADGRDWRVAAAEALVKLGLTNPYASGSGPKC